MALLSHNAFQDADQHEHTLLYTLLPSTKTVQNKHGLCCDTDSSESDQLSQKSVPRASHNKTKRQNDFHLSRKAPKHCHMLFCWYSSKPLKMLYSHVADKKSNWWKSNEELKGLNTPSLAFHSETVSELMCSHFTVDKNDVCK